jgi:nuclear pore complex protein Nup107
MCEEKETAQMRKLGGGWWEGGVDAVENVENVTGEGEEHEEHEWEDEIRASLGGMRSIEVEDG